MSKARSSATKDVELGIDLVVVATTTLGPDPELAGDFLSVDTALFDPVVTALASLFINAHDPRFRVIIISLFVAASRNGELVVAVALATNIELPAFRVGAAFKELVLLVTRTTAAVLTEIAVTVAKEVGLVQGSEFLGIHQVLVVGRFEAAIFSGGETRHGEKREGRENESK